MDAPVFPGEPGAADPTAGTGIAAWAWNGNQGNVDTYQVWSTFAYGYELTGDQVFLQKAAEMLQRDLNPGLFDDRLDNIHNRAALIALLQAF